MLQHAFHRARAGVTATRMATAAAPPLLLARPHVIAAAPRSSTQSVGAHMRMQNRTFRTHAAAALASAPASAPAAASPSAADADTGARVPIDWPVGHESHGFVVVEKTPVADFNLTVYRLEHRESGALAYHVARADADNAFSVAFRTPVGDSTGVAHILEHTVLCGSQRFPVRDPFFLLVRRSLKTFMNAMTAQDYTLYPFSTCNSKDYANLLEVYLDAAFFPLLKPMDFLQEGHRLEIAAKKKEGEEKEAATTPAASTDLQIKGVVYNEMKGAMSDTSQLFLQQLQSNLFPSPSNCNHWNSGGEPSVIPSLTHEQLRGFHKQYYNVANAVFVSYGDMEPPLQIINERVLQQVVRQRAAEQQKEQKEAQTPQYDAEKRFDAPRVVHATCPPDPLVPDPSKQTKVCTAFLCAPLEGSVAGKALSPEGEVEAFALSMLSSLLLDGPTAPMYQSLIDPNIGSGYAPGTGFDNSTQESTFGFGLQGVAEGDVDRVLKLIDETLRRVSVDGFPAERIEAIIHQIELSLKHVRSNFGIGIIMRMTPQWAHGSDPLSPLRVNAHIAALRERLAQGPYFQQLIQKHLLNNPHQLTLVMSPEEGYARRETEEEQARLAEKAKKLTEADREEIQRKARELVELQNSKQDTKGCNLPSLSAADISKVAERIDLDTLTIENDRVVVSSSTPAAAPSSSASSKPSTSAVLPVLPVSSLPPLVSLRQPTNGVGYIRGLVSAKRVPLALRPYLPLYASFLTEMGAGPYGARELSHALDMVTGGISAEVQVFAHLDRSDRHEEMVVFKSLALQRNIPAMLDLLHTVLHEVRFDKDLERLQQLLLQTAAGASSSLQDSGSSYATSDASQHLYAWGHAGEVYGGIKYVQFVNGIVQGLTAATAAGEPEQARRILGEVAEKLNQIAQILMQQGLERTFVVGDDASLAGLQGQLPTFLKTKANGSSSGQVLTPSARGSIEFPFTPAASSVRSFYALPLQVNNVSMVLPTVPYTHPDSARLDVMAKILSSVYIHREVREKGGAYGGHVSHSPDGLLAFSSYRDPNSLRTLDAYRAASPWLLGGDSFSSEDIDEALLSIFSSIDAPKPPAAKGMGQFLYGITNEQRQQYRDRLLAVTKDDVMEACAKYLSDKRLDAAHVSIVGDETSVPAEIRNSAEWKVQAIHLAAGAGEGEGEGFEDDGMEEFDEDDEGEDEQPGSSSGKRAVAGAALGMGVILAVDDEQQQGGAADMQPGQRAYPVIDNSPRAAAAAAGPPRNVFAHFALPPQRAGAGAGVGVGAVRPANDGPLRSFDPSNFLPDLGALQPLSPVLHGAVVGAAGYAVGATARVFTRLTFLLAGLSGAGLYMLHRQGLVEVKWDRLRMMRDSVLAQRHQLADAVDANPRIVQQLQAAVETLLTTSHGLAFTGGFMLAFK